jgi:DNA-binding beta-propeller fold protein YncE
MTFFTKRISSMFAIGLCAIIIASCGGGAVVGTSAMRPQSQSPVVPAQSTNGALSTKAANGNVTFAIGIKPKTKGGRITPKYVSPSTHSLQILTDGTNPVVVDFTWSSEGLNCPRNHMVGAAYVCTVSFNVPAGNHVFTVTTYDLPRATGNVLSTNSTGTVIVKPTGTTKVSIVLEGAVHYVVLQLATNPGVGAAGAIGLTVSLEDADSNLIFGPAPYEHPVTLTTTDSTNGSLSKTALNSPADTSGITVNYSGAKVASITYSATATGLSAANVITADLTPGSPPAIYVTNNTYGSSYRVTAYTAKGTPTGLTISAAGWYPSAAAVDAAGKIYVAHRDNDYSESGTVTTYTANGTPTTPTITGLDDPTAVAVDAAGKIYVTNLSNATLTTYTANGTPTTPTIPGMYNPVSVAVDAAGKIYVLNKDTYLGPTGSVTTYTANGTPTTPTIAASGAIGVAVDAAGKIYLANWGNDSNHGTVTTYTANGTPTTPTITGLPFPTGVAVDTAGKIYVVNMGNDFAGVPNGGSMTTYTAHGTPTTPTITGLYNPVGVAVH